MISTLAANHVASRQRLKRILWLALPLAIALGWRYPVVGFAVLGCMGASIAVAFSHGRAWCDVCPRGTFFDVIMSKVSPNRTLPGWLRSTPIRIGVLVFMMGFMTVRLVQTWGDLPAMGMVFVMLLTITTGIGIVLALVYRPRSWCAFCPMGSMANWIGRGKHPLQVAPSCVGCNRCARVCPMELNPASARTEGAFTHGDCLKCNRCTVSCPKNALAFPGDEGKGDEGMGGAEILRTEAL